jgi:hypothetical protein
MGFKVLMAKNYIDNLSEETRKGMLEKAEQGLWPSFAPLGYLNEGRTIVPDPAVAPIIRKIFEWYATGVYSLAEITRMAKAAGMVFRRSGNPVPRATIHKILHNRIYTGDFDFDGKTYRGRYEPIVSRELWERVQRRLGPRRQKRKHDFAFSGLITCGHCGCSLVGELKKGRYVYYHCTGNKGKCPEPYVREEILETQFTKAVRRLRFDDEVLQWIQAAVQQSQAEERQALARLQAGQTKLQRRLEAMYEDKLDGRIDDAFFQRKSDEYRVEQAKLAEEIERRQQNHNDDGVKVVTRAAELFEQQPATEKRKLLRYLVSDCRWKGGELTFDYKQPFDMLVEQVFYCVDPQYPQLGPVQRFVLLGPVPKRGPQVASAARPVRRSA